MCGPGTYRVVSAEREATQKIKASGWVTDKSDVLWWDDQPIKIDWPSDKVHTFKDAGFPYPISKGLTKKSSKFLTVTPTLSLDDPSRRQIPFC